MPKTDKIRVLLADDHAMVRDGTRRILEGEGDMEVVGEAADGQEAIRLAAATRPDVVLLDIAMPGINGVKATQEIKSVAPSTAVLILSAYDDDAYLFNALEAGAAGYLLKNCRATELVDSVRSVIRGESVLHPVVAAKVLKRLFAGTGKTQESGEPLLTKREVEVLKVAARGLSNKDVGQALGLSSRTVQAHLGNIFNKLNVSSRTEAVISAIRAGILSIEDVQNTPG
ncbi:MAG: response regulator transcription factor [Chloroflexi bacterium]|nr:response regulator transcription factor [Chloroflexota bacterium]